MSRWDEHDFLVDLLERGHRIPQPNEYGASIRRDLLDNAIDLVSGKSCRSDFDYLLDAAARVKQLQRRHFAWAAQAIFHGQACLVGQRILLSNGRSPLVEQLHLEGDKPHYIDPVPHLKRLRRANKTLDVMIHERTKLHEILLIQGYTFGEARRFNPDLTPIAGQPNLFGDRHLYLQNCVAKADDIRGLLIARDLLLHCYPDKKIVPLFLIVSEPESVLHYQAFDLTEMKVNDVRKSFVPLDGWEPTYSSLESRVEATQWQDRLDYSMLNQPPLERAVRLAALLKEFYALQRGERDLVTASRAELGARVSSSILMHYEENLLRHDLEDGLERAGYVRRVWRDETRFAMSPKGVGRATTMIQRGSADPRSAATLVLNEEMRQIERWRRSEIRSR